jgi:hypothetical protein
MVKVGGRYRSRVDGTEVVVVRVDAGSGELECGGVAMVDVQADADVAPAAPGPVTPRGTKLGKRYAGQCIEVMVTKAGQCDLSWVGEPLKLQQAKPLPSSD